jgi:Transposase DNA-binding
MDRRERLDRAALASEELEGAALGDARLERRLVQIAQRLAKKGSQSLPVAMKDEASLEATYRFLGNERVLAEAIMGPHRQRTQQRCQKRGRALALFDTSELRFAGEREQLGRLPNKGRGLVAHVGLAVSADGRRAPLGIVHLETVVRTELKGRKHGSGAADNERLRWHRGAQAVYKSLPEAICVMDREADVYDLVQEMSLRQQCFVVRAAQKARTTEAGPLFELLDDSVRVSKRTVELAERKARKRASDRGLHPARSAHAAKLEVRVRQVVLRSPNSSRNRIASKNASSLALHLVHVIERNAPAGDEPVQWVLLACRPRCCTAYA